MSFFVQKQPSRQSIFRVLAFFIIFRIYYCYYYFCISCLMSMTFLLSESTRIHFYCLFWHVFRSLHGMSIVKGCVQIITRKMIYQLPISMLNSGFACNLHLILPDRADRFYVNFKCTMVTFLNFVPKTTVLHFVTKTSIDTAKNGPLKMASTARTALG